MTVAVHMKLKLRLDTFVVSSTMVQTYDESYVLAKKTGL